MLRGVMCRPTCWHRTSESLLPWPPEPKRSRRALRLKKQLHFSPEIRQTLTKNEHQPGQPKHEPPEVQNGAKEEANPGLLHLPQPKSLGPGASFTPKDLCGQLDTVVTLLVQRAPLGQHLLVPDALRLGVGRAWPDIF